MGRNETAKGKGVIEIFRGQPMVKMRLLMIGALAVVAFLLCLGVATILGQGLSLAGPGETLTNRAILGIGSGIAGLLILWGIRIYGRIYVTELRWDEKSGLVRGQTLRFFGTDSLSFAPEDVTGHSFNHGRLETVEAPWYWLNVRTLPRSLLLDAQGQLPEPELVTSLLGIRLRRWH